MNGKVDMNEVGAKILSQRGMNLKRLAPHGHEWASMGVARDQCHG